jgi:hypothetical protein
LFSFSFSSLDIDLESQKIWKVLSQLSRLCLFYNPSKMKYEMPQYRNYCCNTSHSV